MSEINGPAQTNAVPETKEVKAPKKFSIANINSKLNNMLSAKKINMNTVVGLGES